MVRRVMVFGITKVVTGLVVILAFSVSAFAIDASLKDCWQVATLKSLKPKVYLPIARVTTPLEAIRSLLHSGLEGEDLRGEMVKTDLRAQVFRVQALFRLYRNKKGDPYDFEEFRLIAKRFEDALGAYVDAYGYWKAYLGATELLKTLSNVEKDQETLDHLKEYSSESLKTTLANLTNIMDEDGWIDPLSSKFNIYAQMLGRVLEADFGKQKEDKKFILKILISDLNKLEEMNYDLSILEGPNGLHELRRQVRWLLIYIHALMGKIVIVGDKNLTSSAVHAVTKFIGTTKVQEKFLDFEKLGNIDHQIYIPSIYYTGLSALVGRAGEIKDRGVLLHRYREVAARSKDPSNLEALLSVSSADPNSRKLLNWVDDAVKLGDEIKEARIFKRLRKVLEAQL